MRKVSYRHGLVALMASGIALLPWAGGMGQALAGTETVSLERLGVEDVILLPTISSQYIAQFTKPQTWQVSPKSTINVEFQHSLELLPDRSWLEIAVNDKVVHHVALTKANTDGTKLTIPMPVALLKDFNTLSFRVQQHYTDKCEDPLDKSLWTQILPATKLVFDYTPVVPKVNLNAYPYPIIDPLTYSPAKIHYVLGNGASAPELQALSLVNVHLAQQAQKHEMTTRLTFNDDAGSENEHVVYVGKASSLSSAAKYQASFGDYSLQGGQWTNRSTGQTLSGDQGLIVFFQAPGSQEHTVLLVTGNSDQAVLKAAQYLTTRPHLDTLTGQAVEVPSGWSLPGTRTAKLPRFIENQSRSFRELGFTTQEVHKINAPPIIYKVPVVTDFRKSNGRLWLDLAYSYGPGMNPEYSSLELRMNDVSIGNILLTNPNGEPMKRASIPISNELVRPRNELVAQFHMMPDKYGWCVDNYVDNAWGKIHDDSQIRVEGGVASRLPDIGLLNNTMYPYSREDNLERVQIVLPNNPSKDVLEAMLGFTTRLGRTTLADTDLRLALSQGGGVDTGKNVVVFRNAGDSLNLPQGSRLLWQADGQRLMKLLSLPEPGNGQFSSHLMDLGGGAYMEQYMTVGDRVLSVLTAKEAQGFQTLRRLFETDKLFDTVSLGFLQQATQSEPKPNTVIPTRYHEEVRDTSGAVAGNWFDGLLQWLKALPWIPIMIGLVVVFFLLLILPLLVRRILRK